MPNTILYIEDDPASRSLVERTLRYGGYRVLIADCALEGIDMARREVPDLILTDINLPDMSGREVTTMLRSDARFRTTPIVALTAQTMGEQRELALAAGLTGYLTKPIDVEGLLERVEHYLHGAQEMLDPQAFSDAQTRYSQELVARLEERIRELENVNQSLNPPRHDEGHLHPTDGARTAHAADAGLRLQPLDRRQHRTASADASTTATCAC